MDADAGRSFNGIHIHHQKPETGRSLPGSGTERQLSTDLSKAMVNISEHLLL
jgi:hypothetical protein